MNLRSFIIAINASGVQAPHVRTMDDVTHAARVHVAIECWLEDHNLFKDDDTANQLAAFVMARSSTAPN